MNRVCSIFSQILQLFSRSEFEAAVGKHQGERHARGFTCWGQFIAMLFCQLGRAHSLSEITQGLAASEGKLKHLGLSPSPAKSTLAYANQHRPWELYQPSSFSCWRAAGFWPRRGNPNSASRTSWSASMPASLISASNSTIGHISVAPRVR